MKSYMTRRLIFGLLLSAGLFAVLFFSVRHGTVPVASPQHAQGVELPIIMYHGLLKDVTLSGDYVITPSLFEADLKWLLERGYTPVLIRDVIAYVQGEGNLPQKPIALTFDDGLINNMLYLLPLLEEYDFCVTLAVVGEYAQIYTQNPDPNPSYGYLNWEDVATLAGHPRIEIINHSHSFHRPIPASASRDQLAQYAAIQAEDARMMNELLARNAGVENTVYAYPFGAQPKGTDNLLKDLGFQCTLMCYEHMNTIIQGNPDCLFSLGRFNRPSGISTENFMERLLEGEGSK